MASNFREKAITALCQRKPYAQMHIKAEFFFSGGHRYYTRNCKLLLLRRRLYNYAVLDV